MGESLLFMVVFRQHFIKLMILNRYREFRKFRMKALLLTLCGVIQMVKRVDLVFQREVPDTSSVRTSVTDSCKRII